MMSALLVSDTLMSAYNPPMLIFRLFGTHFEYKIIPLSGILQIYVRPGQVN